jgi:amino acid transporter
MADKDVEKAETNTSAPPQFDYGATDETKTGTKWSRLVDSFKENPNARVVTEAVDAEGKPLPDQPPAEPALAMTLKNRHLQMIAIGGSIGAHTARN